MGAPHFWAGGIGWRRPGFRAAASRRTVGGTPSMSAFGGKADMISTAPSPVLATRRRPESLILAIDQLGNRHAAYKI
jgi:hypothetical protein